MKKLFLIGVVIFSVSAEILAKTYRGGELRTIASYTYGRFEVRMKAAAGAGLLSSFFTYHDNDPAGNWNEIDIEIMGRYDRDVQYNTITPDRSHHVYPQLLSFDPRMDFHTYAIEWTPNYVAWFVDGVESHRQTGSHISTLKHSQKIMMNIWPPLYPDWAGVLNPKILPVYAYYDYVSYASYTPGRGSIGSGNNFTPLWIDHFDQFNPSRWQKATHTFDNNDCDFIPDNVVFKDGYMILCLTTAMHTGMNDRTPPSVLWARAGASSLKVYYSEEVNRTDATNPDNYAVPGATLQQVTLQPDNRTAILTIDNFTPSQNNQLMVMNIRDLSPNENIIVTAATPIIPYQPLPLPVRINVGGGRALGFLADRLWNESSEYGYEDGQAYNQSGYYFTGTFYQQIYQSVRNNLKHYRVRLPNGSYKLTLMMAEAYFNQPGKRVFDVNVQGQRMLSNLDLYQLKGLYGAYEYIVDPVVVEDEILDIHFAATADFPLLNGLVIEPSATHVGGRQALPQEMALYQNYPNPFNDETVIRYDLPVDSEVDVSIHDALGRQIATLYRGRQSGGEHELIWRSFAPSGVYFVTLTAHLPHGTQLQRRKMMLLR